MRWKSLKPSENQEIMTAVEWVSKQEPWLMNHLIRIRNEEKCSEYIGKLLNKQGRLKGASDLFVAWPTSKYYGMFIEAKCVKGSCTKEQKEFIERMNMIGYYATFAFGSHEIIYFIKKYLDNTL